MPEQPRQQSQVNQLLDELDMLNYRLADKLDMYMSPSTPTLGEAKVANTPTNPSVLVMRLRNLVDQLRDIDNRLNI